MGDIIGGLFGKEGKSKQKSTSSSESGNTNAGLINSIFGNYASGIGNYGNAVGNLLGIGGSPSPTPSATPYSNNPTIPGHNTSNQEDLAAPVGGNFLQHIFGHPYTGNNAQPAPEVQTNPTGGAPAPTPVAGADGDPQTSALEAFSNSGGMNFLRDQGIKTINADKSAKGLLQSGSTGTALEKFSNGLASTYLNQYMQNLFDQQRLQLGAGGLLSSAGQYSKSSGTSTGSSNAGKHGLIPDILVAMASAGAGGGGGG